MKTEPTDLDREAARLFLPAPGMRFFTHHRHPGGAWYRAVTPVTCMRDDSLPSLRGRELWPVDVQAIDIDDRGVPKLITAGAPN